MPDSTAQKMLRFAHGLLRDPDLREYLTNRGETEQSLATMGTSTLNRLHRGAGLAARRARTPADRLEAQEFLYRVERALRDRVSPTAETTPVVSLLADDMLTAALMLQALGELLEADELDVRGRTLRAAATLREAAGDAAADAWHLDQARRDIARTLDRARLD